MTTTVTLAAGDVTLAKDLKAAADRLTGRICYNASEAKAIHKLGERAWALGWEGVATLVWDATHGSNVRVAEVQIDLWEAALTILGA